jgi:hypothetical protein
MLMLAPWLALAIRPLHHKLLVQSACGVAHGDPHSKAGMTPWRYFSAMAYFFWR